MLKCAKIPGIAFFIVCLFTIGEQALAQKSSSLVTDSIRLSQIGFYPAAQKIAIVLKAGTGAFAVKTESGHAVFTGKLMPSQQPDLSGRQLYSADFTGLKTPGRYFLDVPMLGRSYSFAIGKNVNKQVAVGAMKGYYFQRTAIRLDAKYAGKWSRALGHPDNSVLIHPSAATAKRPTGTVISSPRGWYDAGDYNKYIVNSGITMGTLLSLYEDFPAQTAAMKLNIPESTNNLPDELDEVLWNLRWMLTMQDPDDGGVYHKLTNAGFDKMIMPDKATAPRYVVQKSTAATLDFAAVMAQAARVFKKFNKQLPGLSDSCERSALSAWQWAVAHPSVIYDQKQMNAAFKPEVTTGDYGDRYFSDELSWAAAELYITTRNDAYLAKIDTTKKFRLPSWAEVGTMAYYSLLRKQNDLTPAGKALIPEISKRVVEYCDGLLNGSDASAYRIVMGKTGKDFIWGSNSVAANQGIALIQAYLFTKNAKYLKAATGNLEYLLGRNGTGYCYLTGFGSKQVMHPHHRQSIADNIVPPVPGLLAAGPNPGQQDGVILKSRVPNEAYADDANSYATNEIAINWNAPFVYLANAIENMQGYLGF